MSKPGEGGASSRRAHESSQPAGAPGLWRLLNAPKAVDPAAMRYACAVFLVAYAIVAIVRYEESHRAFFWLRLLVCLYAAFGVWLARHVTWGRVRAYTVGLAFLLPLQAGYVDGMLGNRASDVAVSTLATFIPLVFIQAGSDLVVVALGLAVGHALVLSVVPAPAVPLTTIAVMLGGAIATGTSAALQILIYRARWSESVDRLQAALAVSAEWRHRYEAASLASGQLLYDWDVQAAGVSYGGACERMLGYTAEELGGARARWVALVHPDDRDALDRAARRTLGAKVPLRAQYRIGRRAGGYVVVEDSGQVVLDDEGRVVRLVGFVSDVTERTRAEAERAEEAATSAALARVGRELISSLETPVVLERLCRLTTEVLRCDFSVTWLWKPDEAVFTPIASSGMPKEEWEAIHVLRVPSSPSTPLFARLAREEIAQVTPESRDYPVTAEVLAYYGVSRVLCLGLRRGGEVIGVQVAGYRTRTAPFSRAQERVGRGVAQLASMALTNAQLVEEIERVSRLKSEFVSTMSHELRTPLNVILGYSDMLADQLTSRGQAALLARVRRSSLELLEMIEATLDLNRLAAGKERPRLESVPLAELWEELSAEFAALPGKARVALVWEPAGVETLDTDRRMLRMILKNLVGNALKFTPAGEIVVSCARDAGGVMIAVRDTGVGIPAEHLPHIFDMFRQVDSSDRRSYGGAGLGLYIVRQLVDRLGGTIAVESELGRGSTFRVVLPDAAESARAAASV